jgi:glycine cleavage system H protein
MRQTGITHFPALPRSGKEVLTMAPPELLYTQTHIWVGREEEEVVLGITDLGLEQYGDVVAAELPGAGAELTHDEYLGELECTRGVWELYCPVDGVVAELNALALDHPDVVNGDPYGEGWLLRVKVKDPQQLSTLLTSDEYEAVVEEEEDLEFEEDEEDDFDLLRDM